MADFFIALRKTLTHEGVIFDHKGRPIPGYTGHVDHPDDPGGETNYGITVAVAREAGWSGAMDRLPYTTVQTIYRKQYWAKVCGRVIPDQEIAEELFDTAVNMGPAAAGAFLQRTLNVLNKKERLYRDVTVDGLVGHKTLVALDAALRVASWYRLAILRGLDCLQGARYIMLSENDPKFETFTPGWLRTRIGR